MPGDGPPILVTGITRSGTTWVASMLNASSEVVYVNEPLNPQHPPGRSPGVLQADVRHRFQYICADNGAEFEDAYRDLVNLRYHLAAELRANHRIADVGRALRHLGMFTRGRIQDRRLMVADPLAVFSAEWFARQMGFRVVVIVRHPLAVVGGRKRLGWRFDLDELLAQPLLLRRNWLNPIETSWPEALRHTNDVVAEGRSCGGWSTKWYPRNTSGCPTCSSFGTRICRLTRWASSEPSTSCWDSPSMSAPSRRSSSRHRRRTRDSSTRRIRMPCNSTAAPTLSPGVAASRQTTPSPLQIAGPLTDRLYPPGALDRHCPWTRRSRFGDPPPAIYPVLATAMVAAVGLAALAVLVGRARRVIRPMVGRLPDALPGSAAVTAQPLGSADVAAGSGHAGREQRLQAGCCSRQPFRPRRSPRLGRRPLASSRWQPADSRAGHSPGRWRLSSCAIAEAGIKALVERPLIHKYDTVRQASVTKDSFNHSFPSGHTVRGLLLAFLIAELVPTLRPLLAAWLVVMSASLVLTSMHTPTDVAGGVLLALVALVMLNQRVRFRLRPAADSQPHTGGIEEPLAPGGVP